jgi:hypothetical protein
MALRRTPSQAFVFPGPLALPTSDNSSHRADHRLPSHAPLAVVVICLTFLLSNLASYLAGRAVEQRTQLGYLLAAAPTLDQLQAATRSADSLSMRFMLQMGRLRTKRIR